MEISTINQSAMTGHLDKKDDHLLIKDHKGKKDIEEHQDKPIRKKVYII